MQPKSRSGGYWRLRTACTCNAPVRDALRALGGVSRALHLPSGSPDTCPLGVPTQSLSLAANHRLSRVHIVPDLHFQGVERPVLMRRPSPCAGMALGWTPTRCSPSARTQECETTCLWAGLSGRWGADHACEELWRLMTAFCVRPHRTSISFDVRFGEGFSGGAQRPRMVPLGHASARQCPSTGSASDTKPAFGP